MKIKQEGHSLFIEGNIKTVGDFQEIKRIIDEMIVHSSTINMMLLDSISMTSSVIGYLTKIVLKDKISLSISVGNEELMALLDDLGVAELLHVRKLG